MDGIEVTNVKRAGRTVSDVSPLDSEITCAPKGGASRHVVLHQHRHGDTPFLHECVDSRLVRVQDGPEQIISIIMTGWTGPMPIPPWRRIGKSLVLYGSEDKRIRRRVDRLRRRRERGICSAGVRGDIGPLELSLIARIYFALQPDPILSHHLREPDSNGVRESKWEKLPSPPSLWDRYKKIHRVRTEKERSRRCHEFLEELRQRCADLPQGPKIEERLLDVLMRKAPTGKGRPRPAHQTPETLSLALGAVALRRDPRTLARRVQFSPSSVATR